MTTRRATLNDTWKDTLRDLEAKGLRRRLKTVDAGGLPRIRLNGSTYLNLASNNYFGFLANNNFIWCNNFQFNIIGHFYYPK